MPIKHTTRYQLFKYSVYVLLAINVYLFWAEEHLAAAVQFSGGVGAGELIDAYAATIDTAAWVVLLLMFEFETYVLDDQQFTSKVTLILQATRAVCYGFIVYAFYGYVVNLTFIYQALVLKDVTDLCSLASAGWSYAIDLDEYTAISAANCGSLSTESTFHRLDGINAVVDSTGLVAIRNLAWVDVVNAAVWLLVVAILEIDVWLQERGHFEGSLLRASNSFKFVLYATLLAAAAYWGFKGDFVDFWDAFLWLVAFVFIEMNVLEWREEVRDAAVTTAS